MPAERLSMRQIREVFPSYYFARPGGSDLLGLRHKELKALIRAGVFGDLGRDAGEARTSVNEHAEHAFLDFGCEVAAAWQKYQEQLALIAAWSPPNTEECWPQRRAAAGTKPAVVRER